MLFRQDYNNAYMRFKW